MGSIKLHLDLQNSMTKTLKESKDSMKGFNSVLEKSSKNFEKVDKTVNKISGNYDDLLKTQKKINKSSKLFEKSLSSIKNLATQALFPVTMLFTSATIIDAAKNVKNFNTQLNRLSYQMGEGGKNTRFLQEELYKVSMATGVTTEKTLEVIKAMKQYRIADKDINVMSSSILRFSEITGASADITNRLAGELMLTGKLSSKSTTSIMAGMVKVQKTVGLTAADMEALTEGIITSTKYLHQLGKTSIEIEKFNKGITRLAAGFATVGLSAKDATAFIDDLLNVDKIEDNALLYAKLGISMSDAISGNIDPGELQTKLKGLGQELKGMDNIAANQLAKSMGKSLGQLRQMADMDLSKSNAAMLGTADGATYLKEAQEESMSAGEKLDKTFNRIHTKIEQLMFGFTKFLKPALIIGAFIAIFVILKKLKKTMKSVATEFSENIEEGVAGGIEMGMKRGNILAQKVSKMGGAFMSSRQQRVRAGSGYAKTQSKADQFSAMAQTDIYGPAKAMSELTAKTLRNYSEMSIPVSQMVQSTNQMNSAISQRLKYTEIEAEKSFDIRKSKIDMLKDEKQINANRLNILHKAERTKEQSWEMNKLIKEQKKLTKEVKNISLDQENTAKNYHKLKNKIVKNLGVEELAQMHESYELQKANANVAMNELVKNAKNLELEKEIVNSAKEELLSKKKAGILDAEGLRELKKLTAESNNYENQLAQNNTEREKEILNIQKASSAQQELANITEKSSKEAKLEGGALYTSFLKKTGNFFSSKLNNASTKLASGFTKFKESAKAMWTNVKEAMRPSNIAKGFAKGAGKLIKSMGKASIQFLLINIALKLFMKVFKPMLEKLKPLFTNLVDKLMPPILEILKGFFPLFAVFANSVAPPILKGLGYLLLGINKLSTFMLDLPFHFAAIGSLKTAEELKAEAMVKKQGLNDLDKELLRSLEKKQLDEGFFGRKLERNELDKIAELIAKKNIKTDEKSVYAKLYDAAKTFEDSGKSIIELGKENEGGFINQEMIDAVANMVYSPTKEEEGEAGAEAEAGTYTGTTLKATQSGVIIQKRGLSIDEQNLKIQEEALAIQKEQLELDRANIQALTDANKLKERELALREAETVRKSVETTGQGMAFVQ